MTITEWLNSERNFAIGAALYDAYGSDALLKQMFDQGFSPLRAKRLVSALSELKDMPGAKPTVQPETPTPVTIDAIQMPEQQVAESEDTYRKEWLPIYQEMAFLRHRLEDAANDVERGEMAFKILELERQCMSLWARRDYFLKYGKDMPDESPQEVVTDRNAMLRRMLTLRTYVSRYSAPSDNPEWPKRLEKYQSELRDLETRINN